MIGNSKWFKQRKYLGWGVSPATWQGWMYVAIFVLLFALIKYLFTGDTQVILNLSLVSILVLDIFHIMFKLFKDEREYKIEAISERNAAWTMILVLLIAIIYQTIQIQISGIGKIDIFLILVLFSGVIAKSISNLYLQRKQL